MTELMLTLKHCMKISTLWQYDKLNPSYHPIYIKNIYFCVHIVNTIYKIMKMNEIYQPKYNASSGIRVEK